MAPPSIRTRLQAVMDAEGHELVATRILGLSENHILPEEIRAAE
jgi:hypothetical protein